MATERGFGGWAVIQFKGYVRTAGFVRLVTFAGAPAWEVTPPATYDATVHVPGNDADGLEIAPPVYWGADLLYSLTPCSREMVERELAPPERLQLAATYGGSRYDDDVYADYRAAEFEDDEDEPPDPELVPEAYAESDDVNDAIRYPPHMFGKAGTPADVFPYYDPPAERPANG